MRYQIGWLFARSRRRSLVSNLAITAFSAPATRRPSYQHHCCTRRPFHGATHLLQVANESSQSDIRPPRREYSNLKIFHWEDEDEDDDRLLLAANIDDPDAERKFRQAQRAFETLKDNDNRAKMLARMFRNLGSLNVKLSLEISFMEAVEGCTKTVTFQTEILCRTCGGTGGPPGEKPDHCRPCGGLGKICHDPDCGYETCSFCCGLGYDLKTLCVSCKGERIVEGTKAVKLDLIPGVDDSETIKVQSEGASSYNGKRGDLYVTIKVKEDLVFQREKSDIHVDATIGLVQAIFGGTVHVPTLMGDVAVKVMPGTQPGQMAIIRGKGIKIKNSDCHGDQYVHFNVKIPENWMERQCLIEDCLKCSRELEKESTKCASIL